MNPNPRKRSASESAYRQDPQPERVEEDVADWFDSEGCDAPGGSSASKSAGADDCEGVFEVGDEDFEAPPGSRKKQGVDDADSKTIFEAIGDGLRTAGKTAQRYTNIGVARAGLEKLRFELRSAHAQLGEIAMRCWADAPDLGLTSNDPAIIDAVKRVKTLRRAVREKQAKIAELRNKKSVV